MSYTLINQEDLGYLGEEYQTFLVKSLIEDQPFFERINTILDQNMFTDVYLKRIVGFMKDRYQESGAVPTYKDLEFIIRSNVSKALDVTTMCAKLDQINNMPWSTSMEVIQNISSNFFKQQNLVKAMNKASDIIRSGKTSHYDEIEVLITKALESNNTQDNSFRLFENLEADLKDDYRKTIPTGADELDKSLYGGLGRGELGLIIAPLGTGKAQPLTSNILTPNGFKLMRDIVVGDDVIGRDGKAYCVSGVFPQGFRPVYKVTFSDGSSCECDEEHLWTVKIGDKNGKFGKYQTMTLNEIDDIFELYDFVVPRCEKVQFSYDGNNDLLSPIKDRIRIFQEMMSVNGSINDSDEYIFNTDNEDVFKKFVSLSKSLGILTHTQEIIGKNELRYEATLKVFDDSINPLVENKDVILSDKSEDVIYITNIEYVRHDFTQCIMVDSEEHLYITDDFIVTHNTSITTGFAASAALTKAPDNNNKGYKVLHYFFEDDKVSIRRKYYGWATNIDAYLLSSDEYKPKALEILGDRDSETRRMLRENIVLERLQSGEHTASDIRQKVKQKISQGFSPQLVIIDYFECLKSERGTSSESEWSREGITMRKLESLANELNIAIWVPIQSTKDSIESEIVGIKQQGGSIKKSQIGHIVLSIAQTMEMKERGVMNLFINKLRASKVGKTKFHNVLFNNGTCRFTFPNEDEQGDVFMNGGISYHNTNQLQAIANNTYQQIQQNKF